MEWLFAEQRTDPSCFFSRTRHHHSDVQLNPPHWGNKISSHILAFREEEIGRSKMLFEGLHDDGDVSASNFGFDAISMMSECSDGAWHRWDANQ